MWVDRSNHKQLVKYRTSYVLFLFLLGVDILFRSLDTVLFRLSRSSDPDILLEKEIVVTWRIVLKHADRTTTRQLLSVCFSRNAISRLLFHSDSISR
jgi:hypothetical protein